MRLKAYWNPSPDTVHWEDANCNYMSRATFDRKNTCLQTKNIIKIDTISQAHILRCHK